MTCAKCVCLVEMHNLEEDNYSITSSNYHLQDDALQIYKRIELHTVKHATMYLKIIYCQCWL